MRDAQNLASLLEVARHTLRRSLLPGLEGERKFEAAMIVNALSVAARALALGVAAEEEERAALAMLPGPAGEAGDLEALRRRLAAGLRDGSFDGVEPSLMRKVLRRRVAARLSIANPDYSRAGQNR